MKKLQVLELKGQGRGIIMEVTHSRLLVAILLPHQTFSPFKILKIEDALLYKIANLTTPNLFTTRTSLFNPDLFNWHFVSFRL